MKKIVSIKNKVLLIGQDADNKLVYSENISWHKYYDGEHLWDDADLIIKYKMVRLRGFLFDDLGSLSQEFENRYNELGKLTATWAKFDDGTENGDRIA